MKCIAVLGLLVCAGTASAGFTVSEASLDLSAFDQDVRNPSGDTYFQAAGLGGTGGFAIATVGAVTDTFNGLSQATGTGIIGGTHTGIAEVNTFGGAGSTGFIRFGLTSPVEMAPSGFNVGGQPANRAGYFLGANAGGSPVDFANGVVVSLATIELLDTSGASLGVSDITAFANFTAGAGGTWDGSLGVAFGVGSAGIGIGGYIITINGTLVPTPATAALLGLGGLVAVRRRR